MFRQIILATIALAIVFASHAQQYGSLKDSRDGKVYKTVKIGTQVWMAENLDVSKFMNGDPILEARSWYEWDNIPEDVKDLVSYRRENNPVPNSVWCYYNNNRTNGFKYGKLYNWYAVIDPRGLCPNGWHVPTDKEWTQLISFLGGEKMAGKKMKLSGFSALPGGGKRIIGFHGESSQAWYWSSTEDSENSCEGCEAEAWNRGIFLGDEGVSRSRSGKGAGCSVRCVKN